MENTKLPKNEFVREQIKNKPKNRKRLVLKLCEAFLCGIMFALAACLVVLFLCPFIRERLQLSQVGSELTQTTEIPSEVSEIEKNTETQSETENSELPAVVELVKELTIHDYQRLQSELYGIGTKVNKSIVTITSVVSDTDWFDNSYERVGQGCGTIIAETEQEYLILTERKLIKEASEIRVTFIDDTVVPARLFQYDGNTGFALVAVDKQNIPPTTKGRISIIERGNSGKIFRGSIVIALGCPLGTNYSILTGTISATNNEMSIWDRNYSVFTTDIVSHKNSSGVLVDIEGKLIGVVMQNHPVSAATTLNALPVAELYPVIDLLSQEKEVPYIGLHVSTVTEQISSAYNLPKGVYIKEVAMDSPAMNAGLQSGDVIVRVDKINVTTDVDYRNVVLSLLPGEEYPVTIRRFGNDGYQEIVCQVRPEVLR